MDRTYSTSPCVLAVFGLLTTIQSVVAADNPNIILVLADDLGWTDTSVRMMAERPDSRSEYYQTPALERLARDGMVFSNAYSPAPTCTPTRSSIQFGKTPARLRQTVVHDVLAKKRGIDCADEVSIAQMIKSVDPSYVTAHFGKWGFPPRRPETAAPWIRSSRSSTNVSVDADKRSNYLPKSSIYDTIIWTIEAFYNNTCINYNRRIIGIIDHYDVIILSNIECILYLCVSFQPIGFRRGVALQ